MALYPQHTDNPGQTWSLGYSTPSKAKQLPALLTEKKNGSRNEQSVGISGHVAKALLLLIFYIGG